MTHVSSYPAGRARHISASRAEAPLCVRDSGCSLLPATRFSAISALMLTVALPPSLLLTFYRSVRYIYPMARVKSKDKSDLLQGTLDMLILKTLSLEHMHGWGISQRIQQISRDVLQVNQGSLYPALHRLELQGWIRSSWGTSENNRRAKFYELTATGQKQLREETENWERLSGAVLRILQTS